MNDIKVYINYLNIILGIIVLITTIVLLVKIVKTSKNITILTNNGQKISNNLSLIQEKTDSIKKTKDSFVFMGSLYIIFSILKDADKYYKRDYSISKSLTRSIMDNSRKLNRIKL